MSLELDPRQRAMLREMGVPVWLPATPVVAAPMSTRAESPPAATPENPAVSLPTAMVKAQSATNLGAEDQVKPRAEGYFEAEVAARAPVQAPGGSGHGQLSWTVGQALSPYPESMTGMGTRWLVLAEMPATALQAGSVRPFDGDAGKLLDNMLRAARLHQAGSLWLAPLVRRAGAPAGQDGLSAALAGLVTAARPDVVLVMGRLAAQALLASAEPFARLRGRVHQLHGIKTIVTHDAGYLLRTPSDKARAWEDLCLALGVAGAPAA